MGDTADREKFDEFEVALQVQQDAVSKERAAILETVEELQRALGELGAREVLLDEAATALCEQTSACLTAARETVEEVTGSDASATRELEEARECIAALQKDLQNTNATQQQLESAEGRVAHLEREVEQQSGLLIEAEQAHKRLRNVEQAYKEQSEVIQLGQAAKRRVAELETTVEEYRNVAKAEQDRATELRDEIDVVRRSEAEAREALLALESEDSPATAERLLETQEELEASVRRVSELEASLETQAEQAVQLEGSIQEMRDALAQRDAAIRDVEQRAAQSEEKRTQQEHETDTLRSRARELAESERSLVQRLESTEAELITLREGTQRAQELEAQLEELQRVREELHDALQHTEEELAHERANSSKVELADQLAEALREREAAQEKIRALQRAAQETEAARAETEPEPVPESEPEPIEVVDPPPEAFQELEIGDGDAKHMMGEIFLAAGIIDETQLEEALELQRAPGRTEHLGAILVSLGYADEMNVAQVVARQRGAEFLRLEPGYVDPKAAGKISARLSKKHTLIPVREERDELVVAMENPLDLIAIEDVERSSGCRVQPAVATPTAIRNAISRVYANTGEEVELDRRR